MEQTRRDCSNLFYTSKLMLEVGQLHDVARPLGATRLLTTKFVSATEVFVKISMKRKGKIPVAAHGIHQGRSPARRYRCQWQPEGQKASVNRSMVVKLGVPW